MPTYEYRCKDCGEPLEIVQRFTDDALTECPSCGGALKKVFGNVGIAFKGSGFYKTDSRGPKSGATNGSSTGGSAGDGHKSDSAGSTSTEGGSKSDGKADSSKSDSSSSSGPSKPSDSKSPAPASS